MIDGILFDKDGTLFDFRKSWGGWARNFLAGIARDAAHSAALAEAIGFIPQENSFHPQSPVIAATAEDIAEALLPHLPGETGAGLKERIDAAAARAEMIEAAPLVPLLSGFRSRGIRLGVATNDSEAPAKAQLGALGLTGHFDFIAGYDSGHGAKPGPGMLLAFMRQHGLEPRRVAMVGDSLHDLEAGRAAGMRRVAVLTGIATAADLAPHADVVLPDIGALPAWIGGLAA